MYMNVYALVCVVYICMVSAHGQHGTAKQPDEEQPHVHAPAYGNTDKVDLILCTSIYHLMMLYIFIFGSFILLGPNE